MARCLGAFGRCAVWVAARLGGRCLDTSSVERRRLFDTVPGPETRERAIFRVVQWDERTREPAQEKRGRRSRPFPDRRRRAIAAGVTLPVVALVAAVVALAYFTSSGTGAGAATVGTLDAPTNVAASATPGTVHVTWTASSSGGGAVAPIGYYLNRYLGATPTVPGGACGTPTVPVNQVACNEHAVADGTYTYTVVAVHKSWTAESAHSASVTVVNDTTPPYVTAIDRTDANPTSASTLRWLVSFSESVTGVDVSDFALAPTGVTGTSITSVSGSGSGPYTVTVDAGSGAGNTGALGLNLVDDNSIKDLANNALGDSVGRANGSFAGEVYTIDRTAPVTTDNAPAGWSSTAVTVTLSPTDAGGSGVPHTYFTTDGSDPTASGTRSDGTSVVVSSEGTTTIKYYSVDGVGNAEATKTTAAQVDLTNPVVSAVTLTNTITGAEGVLKQGSGYVVYANASDTPSGVASVAANVSSLTTGATAVTLAACVSSCTVGATTYAYKSTVQTAHGSLGAGSKSIGVTATDQAGRTGSASGSVTVDNTAPTTTATPSPLANVNGWNSSQPVNVMLGTGSGADTITYDATGATTILSTTYASTFPIADEGTTTVSFHAQDPAGNTESPDKTTAVKIDLTDPTGSVTAPAASANVRGAAVPVSSSSADSGSGVASARFQYSVSGAGNWTNIATDTTSPYSVTWDTTGVTDGLYDLRVTTTDNADRTFTSGLVTVRVDNSAPVVTAVIANALTTTSGFQKQAGTYFVYANVTDTGGSGVNASTVTASESNISGGAGGACRDLSNAAVSCTTVPLTSSGGPFVVNNPGGGTTSYTYRSSQQTAQTTLAEGSKAFSVSAQDNASNSGTSSSATVTIDNTAPSRSTLQMFDANGNGKIDRVVATYSENLSASTDTVRWALANIPSGGSLGSVSTSGTQATLAITEGAGAANTAVGTFTLTYTAAATGIVDYAGNQAITVAATAPADKATPVLVTLTMLDNNTNGKVDRITATFSETLASTTDAAPWTLANVPSSGTKSTLSTSAAIATLLITEGAGAADTSVGALTVTLTASATGIRDAAGNQSSFAATAPSDGAAPVPVTVTDTNGVTNGKMESGDTLVVTFSEPIASAITSPMTITETDPSGGGNDTLSIPGLTNGALNTGSNTYVPGNNSSATFNASTLVLSNGNKTLTATVAGTAAGTTGTGGPATFVFTPAPALRDAAGNAAAGSVSVTAFSIF
jgi:hypothetical protein